MKAVEAEMSSGRFKCSTSFFPLCDQFHNLFSISAFISSLPSHYFGEEELQDSIKSGMDTSVPSSTKAMECFACFYRYTPKLFFGFGIFSGKMRVLCVCILYIFFSRGLQHNSPSWSDDEAEQRQ